MTLTALFQMFSKLIIITDASTKHAVAEHQFSCTFNSWDDCAVCYAQSRSL